jgi:histidyl-tRNA synthetase
MDAEIIALAMHFYRELGVSRLSLVLNSVGCPACRPVYRERLREFARPFVIELCEACQTRYETNPLRMLDCKREKCRALLRDAPDIMDSLCEECRTHFDALRSYLDALSIPYVVDKHLVRGFDYYTKTAFEIVSDALGAQNALGGGGRYDGLVEEIGGPPTPGIGFALGIERAIIVLKALGLAEAKRETVDVFVAALGEGAMLPALQLLQQLRRAGISAETDYQRRSLKGQMKLADRLGCRFTLMLGEDELARGVVTLRDMVAKEQRAVEMGTVVAVVQGMLHADTSRCQSTTSPPSPEGSGEGSG